MSLKSVSPERAREMIDGGAVLVDIREADEHMREKIPGARHLPVSAVENGQSEGFHPGETVIFHCRTGMRTTAKAEKLRGLTDCEAYLVEGGIDEWKKAGLPVAVDRGEPLPIQRQVQIAAGSLIVLGAVLGFTLSPWFHLLSAFVGAGLTQAGITGWCGMALLLKVMPWNRRNAPATAAA
jgi:rhodanese-related sulfurtransferase